MAEAGEKKPVGIWQRYRNLSRTVFALSFVSFLNDTSSEIIYPLLPAFLALSLGATPFAIGLIEGIAESVASILKLFSGYLSDKFNNRKLPVFVGYALAAVVRVQPQSASRYWQCSRSERDPSRQRVCPQRRRVQGLAY